MIDCMETLEKKSSAYGNQSSGDQAALSKAQQIFLNTLPWTYTAQKSIQANLHFTVGIHENGLPQGIQFSARVLGVNTLKRVADCIQVEMSVQDLCVYLRDTKEPVFLMVVDLSQEEIYWLFVQDYIYNTLQETTPEWWQKKTVTLQIPTAQKIYDTWDDFRNTVCYALEFIYIKNYHYCHHRFNERIQEFYQSPQQMDYALQLEASRPYSKTPSTCSCSTSNQSCSSCQDQDPFTELKKQCDQALQNSLAQAQCLKLLDPKENRTAYYLIDQALALHGERASDGIRLTALGEMAFYDYLLHFLKSFDALGTQAISHLTNIADHQRYFKAMGELTDAILEALDLGEIIATSQLAVRLADAYLFATPYIMRTFGQETAGPLMDFAQNLLVTAHDLASLVESPGQMLQ